MTDAEWLICVKPGAMQSFVDDKISSRKLRLFACACCRMIWEQVTDARSRRAVESAEQFVDGFVTEEECQQAADEAFEVNPVSLDREANGRHAAAFAAFDAANLEEGNRPSQAQGSVMYAVAFLAGFPWDAEKQMERQMARQEIERKQADVLRCVVGNPFRPVTIDPRSLTSTVHSLAAGIYTERAFDRMPILADALEEAGCDHADILNHCRGDGPHVRGCWVVDLLLGKE